MKIIIEHPSENSVSLLRRAGYAFQRAEGERLVTAGAWNFSAGPANDMPLEGTIVGELIGLDGEDRVVLRVAPFVVSSS